MTLRSSMEKNELCKKYRFVTYMFHCDTKIGEKYSIDLRFEKLTC